MARTYIWRERPERRLEMYLVMLSLQNMVKHVDHSKQWRDRICFQQGSLVDPGILVLSRDQIVFVCFNGYLVENVFEWERKSLGDPCSSSSDGGLCQSDSKKHEAKSKDVKHTLGVELIRPQKNWMWGMRKDGTLPNIRWIMLPLTEPGEDGKQTGGGRECIYSGILDNLTFGS